MLNFETTYGSVVMMVARDTGEMSGFIVSQCSSVFKYNAALSIRLEGEWRRLIKRVSNVLWEAGSQDHSYVLWVSTERSPINIGQREIKLNKIGLNQLFWIESKTRCMVILLLISGVYKTNIFVHPTSIVFSDIRQTNNLSANLSEWTAYACVLGIMYFK